MLLLLVLIARVLFFLTSTLMFICMHVNFFLNGLQMATDDCGAQSIWKQRHQIPKHEMPSILFYGDSHLTNMKKWLTVPAKKGGPKWLDKKVLKHRHFCAVGGSTFANVHNRVQGIKVPDTQPFRGNLWRYTVAFKELKPDYLILSLGFNDVDKFDRKYKYVKKQHAAAIKKPTPKNAHYFNLTPERFWELEMMDFYESVDEVVDRLRKSFPCTKFIFVGLIRSPKWSDEACHMADNLEWWLKIKHQCKLAPISGFVNRSKHIKKDEVHLAHEGYRLFMDKVLTRMVDMWLGPVNHNLKVPNE